VPLKLWFRKTVESLDLLGDSSEYDLLRRWFSASEVDVEGSRRLRVCRHDDVRFTWT